MQDNIKLTRVLKEQSEIKWQYHIMIHRIYSILERTEHIPTIEKEECSPSHTWLRIAKEW